MSFEMPDKSLDFLIWEVIIPGESGTDWENGMYKLQLGDKHLNIDYFFFHTLL